MKKEILVIAGLTVACILIAGIFSAGLVVGGLLIPSSADRVSETLAPIVPQIVEAAPSDNNAPANSSVLKSFFI